MTNNCQVFVANPAKPWVVHPEQKDDEVFLGNFDPRFAKYAIVWKTKRIGRIAYQANGARFPASVYPDYLPVPVFADRMEVSVTIRCKR